MRRIPMNPGDVWGRLTVIREERKTVLCRCECGTERWFDRKHIRGGHTTSCGCFWRERVRETKNRKHGMTGTSTYVSWSSAKGRCTNPKNKSYDDYGARGIKMCDRWVNSFDNFLADMGEKPRGMTLERRDVNGPYAPGNCEWATQKEQTRNRRNTISVTYLGETKTLGEWCEQLGLRYDCAHQMLGYGQSPEIVFAKARRIGDREPKPNYNALITVETALAILRDPRPQTQIAAAYGASKSTVWNIKHGRSWKNAIERLLKQAA